MWDLAMDLRTGELLFDANRDVVAITGPRHIQQRILTRLRIKRGLWLYDENHDLGSRLDLVFQYQPDRAAREIPALVREALAPMADIEVVNVTVLGNPENSRELAAGIEYRTTGPFASDIHEITVPLSA